MWNTQVFTFEVYEIEAGRGDELTLPGASLTFSLTRRQWMPIRVTNREMMLNLPPFSSAKLGTTPCARTLMYETHAHQLLVFKKLLL